MVQVAQLALYLANHGRAMEAGRGHLLMLCVEPMVLRLHSYRYSTFY